MTMMPTDRPLPAIFTPTRVETRFNVRNQPYLYARGTITLRKRVLERTVVAYGRYYYAVRSAVSVDQPVKLIGFYRRVDDDTMSSHEGGEYFRAFRVDRTFDGSSVRYRKTGRTVTGHYRKGYYRRQRYGAGRALVKMVWINATAVNGGRPH